MTTDILTKLQAAQTDAEREWIVMAFSLANLEPAVREAVWAAAIPHWFDAPFLAALLDLPTAEAQPIYARLISLSYVEPFPGCGHNVHERTRSLLLDRLWRDDPDRYRALSRRAADYCGRQDQADTAWRVETLYHQLLGEQPWAADAFISQGIEWYNRFEYERLEALVRAVLEAVDARRLSGRAAAWAHYWQGRLHVTYSRYREAEAALMMALDAAGNDRALQANCIKSLGDVHYMLAEYALARQRYAEALPIYQAIGDRLGAANCISSLGDVHLRLAEYALARQRYAEALPIYQAIGARLGAANCISSLGDVHLAEGDEAAALAAYEDAFARYLALGLPNGAASALTSQITIHERRRDYAAALPLYTRAVELAPENPMWYRNRAGGYINLKDADRAAADIETAARLQPEHPYLHLHRGNLAILRGDYDAALAELSAFAAAFPNSNGSHFALARGHLLRRDTAAALEAVERALALTHEAQDVRDAIYDLEEVQREHGDLPGLAEALGRLQRWLVEKQAQDQP